MTKIRTFLVGALLMTVFLATPQGQDSIIRLTGDGWLVAAGNRVPLLLGSDGKGFLKVDVDGTVSFINGGTFNFPVSTDCGTATGFRVTATPTALICVGGTAVVTTSSTAVTSTVQVLLATGSAAAPSLTFSTEAGLDSGFYSVGANSIGFSAGGTRAGYFNSADFVIERTIYVGTNFYEGIESTAPAAPAANGYRIYAQDNGAGKTQLMVIFSSGAAQQIAIQP